jgi:motility quorum-sensing regulator/GCU-specific mRNA interferase toxin
MEHFKFATYDLDKLKALLQNKATRVITGEARRNAAQLGFLTDKEIIEQCLALKGKDIYKTMTTHYDHALWQDVYKKICREHPCYIKLQKSYDGKAVIIQFKMDESA